MRGTATWVAHLWALVWTVILVGLLLTPGSAVEAPLRLFVPLPPGSDKFFHALFFGIETWLLWRAMRHWPRPSRPSGSVTGAALVAAVLGLLTEVGQHWVPMRRADGFDLAANTLGVVFAWSCLAYRLRGASELEKG